MILHIKQKSNGKKNRRIQTVPMYYEKCPDNLEELLEYTVINMVEAFNERVRKGMSDEGIKSISEEQLKTMADIGKISFGIVYNDKEQDIDKAVETAIMAYIDGMVRIFINGELAGEVDTKEQLKAYKLNLKEEDEITFVRLTTLAGRMW